MVVHYGSMKKKPDYDAMDLAHLTIFAATEIDNIILQRSQSKDRLSELANVVHDYAPQDYSGLVKMHYSVWSVFRKFLSERNPDMKTVEDLGLEMRLLASELRDVQINQLPNLRDNLVDLSKNFTSAHLYYAIRRNCRFAA